MARAFTIGWICALPVEVDAARAVLDEEYLDDGQALNYILGRVGVHNVVVTWPPAGQYGIAAVAVVAERLKGEFPTLRHGLLVGVGGGVPSPNIDIRLGDVVVSQPGATYGGVVQYDMGKSAPDGKRLRTGFLNSPPVDLLIAVSKLRSNLQSGASYLHTRIAALASTMSFSRPNSNTDVLFKAEYNHVASPDCSQCLRENLVTRTPRGDNPVRIHYGLIGSGNQVIRVGVPRNNLSSEHGGLLCFEMEAAGVMNNLPSLVVRGICDYADSHKTKLWQPFAAMTAAACAKEVLLLTNASNQAGQYSSQKSSVPAAAQETDWKKLIASLKYPAMEVRHLSIKPALVNTCEWLLSPPEFVTWLRDRSLDRYNVLLWLKGKAATGKSTMMKFVCNHLAMQEVGSLVVSFFFNARGRDLEKSLHGMYRSVLYQLLRSEMTALCDGRSRSFRFYFALLIERLQGEKIILLVDALDECGDNEVIQMVNFFYDISLDAASAGTHLRILFSSRHYPHIPTDGGISLTLEDQREHEYDIVEYVRSQLKAGHSQATEATRSEIYVRSSGVFLWVALVVGILNDEFRRGRVRAMEERLVDVPEGIQHLFTDILNRERLYSDETVSCLRWVLFSRRPLTVAELYFAITTELSPDAPAVWMAAEVTIEDMKRFILDVSRGLVECVGANGTAQVIHESVRETLLAGNVSTAHLFGSADMFQARSHDRLKHCCMVHIQKVEKEASEFQTAGHLRRGGKKFPFLVYATSQVLYHCDTAHRLGLDQSDFAYEFDYGMYDRLQNERFNPLNLMDVQDLTLQWSSKPTMLQNLIHNDLRMLVADGVRAEFCKTSESSKFFVLATLAASNTKNREIILREQALSAQALQAVSLGVTISYDAGVLISHQKQRELECMENVALLMWAVENSHEALVQVLLAVRENKNTRFLHLYWDILPSAIKTAKWSSKGPHLHILKSLLQYLTTKCQMRAYLMLLVLERKFWRDEVILIKELMGSLEHCSAVANNIGLFLSEIVSRGHTRRAYEYCQWTLAIVVDDPTTSQGFLQDLATCALTYAFKEMPHHPKTSHWLSNEAICAHVLGTNNALESLAQISGGKAMLELVHRVDDADAAREVRGFVVRRALQMIEFDLQLTECPRDEGLEGVPQSTIDELHRCQELYIFLYSRVRIDTVSPSMPGNRHLFIFERYAIMVHGYTSRFDSIRVTMRQELADDAYENVKEASFFGYTAAMVMTFLCGLHHYSTAWQHQYSLGEMQDALRKTQEWSSRQHGDAYCLCICVTDGSRTVISRHSHVWPQLLPILFWKVTNGPRETPLT